MNPQPELYDLNSGYQAKTFRHLIKLVKPNVKAGQHILDIGCGSGRSTYDLHTGIFGRYELKGKTTGLDVLPEMIEKAKQSYKIDETISFVQADIADPSTINLTNKLLNSAKGNKFDHIVTAFCLHWVEDQEQALFNIRQLMENSPGSSLHMIVFLEIHKFFDYAITKILENPSWAPYLKDLKCRADNLLVPWKRAWVMTKNPLKTYKKMMVEAGFEENKIKFSTFPAPFQYYKYSCMEEMQNTIHACFPDCLQSFNGLDSLRDDFFTELIYHITTYNETVNGDKLVTTMPIIYLHYTI